MNDYDINSTAAQLWSYMQHQEDVQHERMAKTYYLRFLPASPDREPDAREFGASPPRST